MGDGSPAPARICSRTSLADFLGPGTGGAAGIPKARWLLGVCRRLGSVFGEPWRRARHVQGSVLEIWAAQLRNVARRAARRGYRNALHGLGAAAGDRFLP